MVRQTTEGRTLQAGLLGLAALLGVAGLVLPLRAAPYAFAIVNARIVDGTGREPFTGGVIIEGDRILRVGPQVEVPAGARVIDARGMTVTPGFFDLHVHLFEPPLGSLAPDLGKHLAAYLYCGVTSIAELSTSPASFTSFRELLASGVLHGPRVSLAARVAVPGGHGTQGGWPSLHTQLVSTPDEARAAVRRVGAFLPDLVKAFADGWRYGKAPDLASMDVDILTAVSQEARRFGMRVSSHTVTAEGARVAADGGVATLVHGIGDHAVDARLANGLRQRNMTYVPALAVYEPRERDRFTNLLWDVLEPRVRELVCDRTVTASGGTGDSSAPEVRARSWGVLVDNVRRLRDAGVRLGVGTDAGVSGTPHGWSTLREMRLLVEAGLTPLEALTAATGNSAWALGVQDDRGLIAAGQRADLVMLGGDPLANIADVERVQRVFLNGDEVNRAALRAFITSDAPSPLPLARVSSPILDDFEGDDGRSDRNSLWMDGTESGTRPTKVNMERIPRGDEGHALRVTAEMSQARSPFARVALPLVPGGLLAADASRFRGLRFDARGEGRYRVLLETRAVRNGHFHESSFSASSKWIPVAIHFTSASRSGNGPQSPWTGRDVMAIAFEIARAPGTSGWLELDNLRFY